jgi:hypothetical protein
MSLPLWMDDELTAQGRRYDRERARRYYEGELEDRVMRGELSDEEQMAHERKIRNAPLPPDWIAYYREHIPELYALYMKRKEK